MASKIRKAGALSPMAIKKVRENKDLHLKMAADKHINKSYSTIMRWISLNHRSLSLPACLDVITQETGLSRSEILN
jgi:hypothetical protein